MIVCYAYLAMFEPFLQFLTFLICSFFRVWKDLLVRCSGTNWCISVYVICMSRNTSVIPLMHVKVTYPLWLVVFSYASFVCWLQIISSLNIFCSNAVVYTKTFYFHKRKFNLVFPVVIASITFSTLGTIS